MLSKEYIAGLFDGEGYFTLRRSNPGGKYSPRQWRFQAYGNITLRERHLLDLVQTSLGYGWCSQHSQETEKHCAYHTFNLTGPNLKRFCEEVGPHMIIKKDRAELILEVQNIKQQIKNKPVSDEFYNRQVELKEMLAKLNKRGPIVN